MKYLGDSFSVGVGGSKEYRDNWERIFGKKAEKPDPWANERDKEDRPKTMDELPPPRDAQPAPGTFQEFAEKVGAPTVSVLATKPRKAKKPKKTKVPKKAKHGKTKKK